MQDLSTRVSLPEPANLLISDLRGVLPLFGRHIPAIVDTRRRLLANGATLIPCRDEMSAAVVEAPSLFGELVGPFGDTRYGLDLSPSRRFVVNTWGRGQLQ